MHVLRRRTSDYSRVIIEKQISYTWLSLAMRTKYLCRLVILQYLSPCFALLTQINLNSRTSDISRSSRKWAESEREIGKLVLGTNDLCSYNNISLPSRGRVARQRFKAGSRDGNRPTNDEILRRRRDSDKNSRKLFSLSPSLWILGLAESENRGAMLKVYSLVYRFCSLCLNLWFNVHETVDDLCQPLLLLFRERLRIATTTFATTKRILLLFLKRHWNASLCFAEN